MADIFISHASTDKSLVDQFVDLLQTGGNIREEVIFCSSVDGMGIETGEAFVEWIRENLRESRLVVLLLSPNYFHSRFCVAEMGAAWGSDMNVFPIVIPSMPRDVGAVFLGRQTARLDDAGLDELRDRLTQAVPNVASSTGRWNLKKAEFLEALPEILENLPEPELVEAAKVDELRRMVEAATEIDKERRQVIHGLEEQIKSLKKLKDRAEVDAWEAEHREPDDQWQELITRVQKGVAELDRPEVRALYASVIDDPWGPGSTTWDYWRSEINASRERKLIIEVDDGVYLANEDHPRIRTSLAAIRELESFLEHEARPELLARLEEDLGFPIDVDNRELWEELFLKGDPFLE